jgi:hypothetical protein
MGSIHSGRRDGKPLVEDCLSLDLAWLMRLGPIREGQAGSGEIKWSLNGVTIASAHFRLDLRDTETERLILDLARPDGHCRPIKQTIALTALPQHFGGRRWWMLCPVTGKRARTLHLMPNGDIFASRGAMGLAYRVERLGRFDRPFEKRVRAQRRLGGAQALGRAVKRPKGMWNRTFAWHVAALEQCDLACVEQIASLIEKAR